MRRRAELEELLEVPARVRPAHVRRVVVVVVRVGGGGGGEPSELVRDRALRQPGHERVLGGALDVRGERAEDVASRLVARDEEDPARADVLVERGDRDARHARRLDRDGEDVEVGVAHLGRARGGGVRPGDARRRVAPRDDVRQERADEGGDGERGDAEEEQARHPALAADEGGRAGGTGAPTATATVVRAHPPRVTRATGGRSE